MVLKKAVSLQPQKKTFFRIKIFGFPLRVGKSPAGRRSIRGRKTEIQIINGKAIQDCLRFDSLYYHKSIFDFQFLIFDYQIKNHQSKIKNGQRSLTWWKNIYENR